MEVKSAKECVTTHLPNELAPKMDGASACHLDTATEAHARLLCVGGRGARYEGEPVRVAGTGSSADLGGSSKYSSENLEG